MIVQVCVSVAENAEDANRQCKKLEAYRKILRDYPKEKFNRKYAGTRQEKSAGVWLVSFEVNELKD